MNVLFLGGASVARERGPLFVHNIEGRLAFLRRYRGAWRAALAREWIVFGVALRFAYWRLRARLERHPSVHTHDQVERFAAVWKWRWRGRA